MAIFKCKMCGGTLEINPGESVATCEYCGSQQTLPKLDDDRRANLYDRANHFRRNNEYDKAERIYEQILSEDPTDAEAYWSIVLCRYGIEYVEDPATHKRVPTVNRAQYTSIVDDDNYKSAIEHADTYQRTVYENEAKAINEIQKGILAISQKEEPFDVFICYKEMDNSGRRTRDSVLANDLYHQLIQEGFKVFFSRITLEDKLGTAYEPYIFAALNSAKVMVVLGTKPEYFNAVWVKNEWSRYLALVNQSGGKKVLIPAYRDMDPYDLPEEFSHLQAQDMSKLGFMQDLIRGIKKIAKKDEPKVETVSRQNDSASGNSNVNSLLKRVSIFLEDGDWNSADEYCEKVLDIDPENAQAYVGKLMAELKVRKIEQLADCANPFDNRNNYKKAVRFGDDKLVFELDGYNTHIRERKKTDHKNGIYDEAISLMNSAKNVEGFESAEKRFRAIPGWKNSDQLAEQCVEQAKRCQYDTAVKAMKVASTESDYKEASRLFGIVSGYIDSDKLSKECLDKAETARKDAIYNGAKQKSEQQSIESLEKAIAKYKEISGWRDTDTQIELCKQKIKDIKAKEEADRLEAERKAEELRIASEKRRKKAKKVTAITLSSVAVVLAVVIVLMTVIIPSTKYNEAKELFDAGKKVEAARLFTKCRSFSDASEYCNALWDEIASREHISGGWHTVGLKSDGTVVANKYTGDQEYYDGQCDVSEWRDIVAVAAGTRHTVGLKSDGTVVATKYTCNHEDYDGRCEVSEWRDIVSVAAGPSHTVGLKSDGTVVAVGNNGYGECDVKDWSGIIAVAAGWYYTVGLKSDGTVVAVGDNDEGQCDVNDWSDIVAVEAGLFHTVGLKSDGTVVAVGENDYGQCDIKDWRDIVAVAAGFGHTVGLKSDGTVVAVGYNDDGRCNISDWRDIKTYNI